MKIKEFKQFTAEDIKKCLMEMGKKEETPVVKDRPNRATRRGNSDAQVEWDMMVEKEKYYSEN